MASLDIDPDTVFLDNLAHLNQATQWSATIQVNEEPMTFKLDTGVEVTAISSTAHQMLGNVQLITSDKVLYGPSRQPLQVVGRFTATLTHKDWSSQHQVYVVKELDTNLLGLPAITSLNLAVDAAAHTRNRSYNDRVRNKFPSLQWPRQP